MNRMSCLVDLLEDSARRHPTKVAVGIPDGRTITYAELAGLSDQLRDRLWHLGVRRGDRVGLRLHKSIDAVAAIFGILKAGAAYVPVDAESPPGRGAYILNDCSVKVILTERVLKDDLVQELQKRGAAPAVMALEPGDSEIPLRALLNAMQEAEPAPRVESIRAYCDDVAYILYTSGSTGNPKGVVLSHGNAASFIDWCSDIFRPVEGDVFSSHAPFHFDLSILDIFVSIRHGARLVLFGENLGKDPKTLASAISTERITIWYSTPSILNLLSHYGKLERYDYSLLRTVLFAGEVFPVPQFRRLHTAWRGPRYFNLYGPTETNVCTYYEVPNDGSWAQMDTFPIGRICAPNNGMVVNDKDQRVPQGEPGELLVSGPNVMRGYWNLREQNERAFLFDDRGERWYRTGDIVVENSNGQYRYMGRRDRMVKRRGYRVELGEIEAALIRHEGLREVAVVAVSDSDSGVRIAAFVSCRKDCVLTIIALKKLSSQCLPPYMIPDTFTVMEALPRTSTGKIDLQALRFRA